MKPQIIRAECLTRAEQQRIVAWLRANGCPWLIPEDSTIKVTGNYVTVETWTIRSFRQARTMWPRHFPNGWKIPTKVRKYRIRWEL